MSEERKRVQVDCSNDKIITKQSFKNECDINRIMAKYLKTGVMSDAALNQRNAIFADVSEIGDFQQNQQVIQEADKAFNTLPPEIRNRFHNSPAQLLDFCSNPENREEAIELGIITQVDETPLPEPPGPKTVPKEERQPAQPTPDEPTKEPQAPKV